MDRVIGALASMTPRPPLLSCEQLFEMAVNFATMMWDRHKELEATAIVINKSHMYFIEISEHMPSLMLYAVAAAHQAEVVIVTSFASTRSGDGEEVDEAYHDAAVGRGCLCHMNELQGGPESYAMHGICVAMRYPDPKSRTVVRMFEINTQDGSLTRFYPDLDQHVAMLPPVNWLEMTESMRGRIQTHVARSQEEAEQFMKEVKLQDVRPVGSEKCIACDGSGYNTRTRVDDTGTSIKSDRTICPCCGGRGWVRFSEA